jgi:hypothetical protein
MTYRLIVLLLIATPCWSQTGTTGKAETSGSCSPAVTGSNNQFTITCQGIPEKLRVQLVDLLNLIAKNQSNAAVMMTKLDGCVAGVNQIVEKEAPRHLSPQQREIIIRTLSQFKGQRLGTIVNNSKRENREFLSEVKDVLVASGWDVYEQGVMIAGAEPMGIVITVGEKDTALPAVQGLVRVFEAAGIANVKFEFQPSSDPENKYMFGKVKPGVILMQVGDKP